MKTLLYYLYILLIGCLHLFTMECKSQSSSFQKSIDLNIYDVIGIAPYNTKNSTDSTKHIVCFNAQVANEGKFDIVILQIDSSGKLGNNKILTNNPDFHDWVVESMKYEDDYYLTGSSRSFDTSSFSYESAYMLRLNSNLDIISQTNYFIDGQELFAKSISTTNDGNLIISGSTVKGNEWSFFLLKSNKLGNIIWYKQYKAFNGIDVGSVRELTNGDLMIVGSIAYTFQYIMPTAIRFSPNGKIVWSKIFNYNIDPFANQNSSLKFINDFGNDRILLAGKTDYSAEAANGYMDSYAIMIDNDGKTIWAKTFGESQSDWPNSYSVSSNNQLVITGSTASFYNFSNFGFAQFIDTSGKLVNSYVFGDTSQLEQLVLSGSSQIGAEKYIISGFKRIGNDFNFYFTDLLISATDGCPIYTVDFNVLDASTYPVNNYVLEIDSSLSPYTSSKVFHFYTGINESIICESIPNSTSDNNKPENNILSVFPNPASNMININVKVLDSTDKVSISIYNNTGVKVYSQISPVEENLEIDLDHYPSGLYIVEARCNEKNTSKKFIKM